MARPPTEFASLTALTEGAVGDAVLALAEEACVRWDTVAAIGLTELFFDRWTFGADDKASYLAFAKAEDWPRTYAKTIDEAASLDRGVAFGRRDEVRREGRGGRDIPRLQGGCRGASAVGWPDQPRRPGLPRAARRRRPARDLGVLRARGQGAGRGRGARARPARRRPRAVRDLDRDVGQGRRRRGRRSSPRRNCGAASRRRCEVGRWHPPSYRRASSIPSHWRELRVLWNPPR